MAQPHPKLRSLARTKLTIFDLVSRPHLGILLFNISVLLGLALYISSSNNKPFLWQQTFTFDPLILDEFHRRVPDWLGQILIQAYRVTGAEVTAFVVLGFLGLFLQKRLWTEAIIFAFSTLGILLSNDYLLKPFFLRLRPEGWLVEVTGRSFPSGHVTGNFFLYLFVAFVFSHYYPKYRNWLYSFAIFMIALIGLASMYVRVHWFSDLIAGLMVGHLWWVGAIALLRWMDKRYRPPAPNPKTTV
jgi:membrane-associated phospholipid phosphatase